MKLALSQRWPERDAPYGPSPRRSVSPVEDVQKEQENVESIQENGRCQHWGRVDITTRPESLEVEHRQARKDDQTGNRIDECTIRNLNEDQDNAEQDEDEESPETGARREPTGRVGCQ